MNLSSSYTACVGCFLECGEGVILCGTEILFVSVVGAWSGTLSLVIHLLILAMSRIGFITYIILVFLVYTWYQCAKSRSYGILFTVLQYLHANHSVYPLWIDNLQNLDVDSRVIRQRILKKCDERTWTGFIRSTTEKSGGLL